MKQKLTRKEIIKKYDFLKDKNKNLAYMIDINHKMNMLKGLHNNSLVKKINLINRYLNAYKFDMKNNFNTTKSKDMQNEIDFDDNISIKDIDKAIRFFNYLKINDIKINEISKNEILDKVLTSNKYIRNLFKINKKLEIINNLNSNKIGGADGALSGEDGKVKMTHENILNELDILIGEGERKTHHISHKASIAQQYLSDYATSLNQKQDENKLFYEKALTELAAQKISQKAKTGELEELKRQNKDLNLEIEEYGKKLNEIKEYAVRSNKNLSLYDEQYSKLADAIQKINQNERLVNSFDNNSYQTLQDAIKSLNDNRNDLDSLRSVNEDINNFAEESLDRNDDNKEISNIPTDLGKEEASNVQAVEVKPPDEKLVSDTQKLVNESTQSGGSISDKLDSYKFLNNKFFDDMNVTHDKINDNILEIKRKQNLEDLLDNNSSYKNSLESVYDKQYIDSILGISYNKIGGANSSSESVARAEASNKANNDLTQAENNEKEYKEIKKKYVEDIKYYLNSKNIYHEGVNIIDFIDIYHDGDSLIVNLDTNLLSNLIYSKNVTVQSNQITTEKQKEDIIKKVEEVKPPTENGNYSLNPVNGQLTNEESSSSNKIKIEIDNNRAIVKGDSVQEMIRQLVSQQNLPDQMKDVIITTIYNKIIQKPDQRAGAISSSAIPLDQSTSQIFDIPFENILNVTTDTMKKFIETRPENSYDQVKNWENLYQIQQKTKFIGSIYQALKNCEKIGSEDKSIPIQITVDNGADINTIRDNMKKVDVRHNKYLKFTINELTNILNKIIIFGEYLDKYRQSKKILDNMLASYDIKDINESNLVTDYEKYADYKYKESSEKYKRIKKMRGKPKFEELESKLENIGDINEENIKLCSDMTCGNKVMCFEYNGKIWKESRKSMNYNRDYCVVDDCKELFGLKKIGIIRVLSNFRIEKIDKSKKSWKDNWHKV